MLFNIYIRNKFARVHMSVIACILFNMVVFLNGSYCLQYYVGIQENGPISISVLGRLRKRDLHCIYPWQGCRQ